MALSRNHYINLYKDLTNEELIKKYTEIKSKYNFQTKDEKIKYIIKSYLEPKNEEASIVVLEDILKERGNEKYIIKEYEFEITLYDIINFISNQNNDPSLNDKLTNFFEKLNIMKEEKIKFLIEIVQDNVSFNNFIAEISNESNENEIYEKYKKLAVYYCAMHSIDA